jgi:hypothetical protein
LNTNWKNCNHRKENISEEVEDCQKRRKAVVLEEVEDPPELGPT